MIDILLVAVSIVMILFSLFVAARLFRIVEEREIRRTWVVTFAHIFFFIVGYISYLVLVSLLVLDVERIRFLSGVVFFNSALFITVIISLSTRVIKDLEHKSMELKNWNSILKVRVKQRTSELEKSNKLKDLFISVMNHDLKNPLTSVRGFSEFTLGQTKEDQSKDAMKRIMDDARRMERLIGDARLYSKLKDKAFRQRRKPIDINNMIESIIPEFDIKCRQKKIKIINKTRHKVIVPALPVVDEIFRNLIDNAVKFSPERSEVTISIESNDKEAIVSVADKGSGVKDEYKHMIFERFERADAREAIEGSGLGLAICDQIVNMHHGKIWVEDNPGGGALFRVRFPK